MKRNLLIVLAIRFLSSCEEAIIIDSNSSANNTNGGIIETFFVRL